MSTARRSKSSNGVNMRACWSIATCAKFVPLLHFVNQKVSKYGYCGFQAGVPPCRLMKDVLPLLVALLATLALLRKIVEGCEIEPVKARIQASRLDQGIVGAALDDLALLQH